MSQATWKKTTVPLTPRVIRLLREVALYLLAAIGVYLLIALWTYQPEDPSWSHRGASAAIANGEAASGRGSRTCFSTSSGTSPISSRS